MINRIFLIGYMGVGKTTVGKVLSKKLGYQFIDLDNYIENRFRKTIQEIFDVKGEDKFRGIEREMLSEVATFEKVVIATGGGTPCFYDNIDVMNKQGITIYIKASVEQLVSRLLASKNVRPIIKGKSPEELKDFVKTHLAEREPFYAKADLIYLTDRLVTDNHVIITVDRITDILENIAKS